MFCICNYFEDCKRSRLLSGTSRDFPVFLLKSTQACGAAKEIVLLIKFFSDCAFSHLFVAVGAANGDA